MRRMCLSYLASVGTKTLLSFDSSNAPLNLEPLTSKPVKNFFLQQRHHLSRLRLAWLHGEGQNIARHWLLVIYASTQHALEFGI